MVDYMAALATICFMLFLGAWTHQPQVDCTIVELCCLSGPKSKRHSACFDHHCSFTSPLTTLQYDD